MTESDWFTSTSPTEMLTFLRGRGASDRKLRLAVAATYRRVLEVFVGAHWRDIIALVEQWVDGEVREADLTRATDRYRAMCNHSQSDPEVYLASAILHLTAAAWRFHPDLAFDCCSTAYSGVLAGYGRAWSPSLRDQYRREVQEWAGDSVRDAVGNPLRVVEFPPEWRTGTVVALAQGIYEERAFDRLPLLMDALMDAGCADEDVLGHCRQMTGHHRGCWVVDLVLGKE